MSILTVKVFGQTEVLTVPTRVIGAIDRDKILDEATALMLNVMRQRFQAQKDPDNISWIPSKAAQRENRNTLFKTGRLFRSIQAFKTSEDERAIGTDVPYAVYHQKANPPRIRRAFLGFNDGDAALTEELLRRRFSKFKIKVT